MSKCLEKVDIKEYKISWNEDPESDRKLSFKLGGLISVGIRKGGDESKGRESTGK